MISDVAQRWRDRRASYRPAGEVFDPRRFEVAPIAGDGADNIARAFVEAHHYSGSYPAARRRFGLYEGAELVGVAVFSQPVNNATVSSCLPGPAIESVELGRFVLLDHVRANGESWFLARCFEALRRESFVGLVSFSDPEPRTTSTGAVVFAGHVGTIYQATNAVYLGRSRADTVRLLPDGRVLSSRAVAKLRARGRERGWEHVFALLRSVGARPMRDGEAWDAWIDDALATVTRKSRRLGNHKYVWAFDRAARRALPASLPYPKFQRAA